MRTMRSSQENEGISPRDYGLLWKRIGILASRASAVHQCIFRLYVAVFEEGVLMASELILPYS